MTDNANPAPAPEYRPVPFTEVPLAEQFRSLQRQVQLDVIQALSGQDLSADLQAKITAAIEARFQAAGRQFFAELSKLKDGHERVWGPTNWSPPDDRPTEHPAPGTDSGD